MASGDSKPSRSADGTRSLVSLTGPAGNIGDALIRRETLGWARDTSTDLIAYTGAAPDVWLHQLGMPQDAQVLRSKRSVARWLWLLVTAPRHPVLIFEAGEIPLDRGNELRELVFLAETLIARLKGGVVIRPPRGIRAPSWPSLAIHRLAARASQVTLWRDAATRAIARCGRLAPDIGFAAGIRTGRPWQERAELLVSLRGTRPMPDEAWIRSVREYAAKTDLTIRTVVQVREDEDRARELAEALGGTYEPWGATDPVAQEERLRERYDAARMVISDRMHVLVLAALSGAVPVELVPRPTAKITEAFSTIGYRGFSMDAAPADVQRMTAFLDSQQDRAPELRDCVQEAETSLARIHEEISALISKVRA